MTNRTHVQNLEIMGSDGVRLHALTRGRSGRLILFLHGFPECCHAWHRQQAEFGDEYRTVAVDLRGYNKSDKPRGRENYAIQKIVADVREVLLKLSPGEPAIVIGHDWGGIVTWSLAREHPELLDRIVIINAPHLSVFRRELKHSAAQLFSSSYAAFFQLRGLSEFALRIFRFAGLRAMIYKTSTKPEMFSPEVREQYIEAWRQPYALTAGLNYYRNPQALNTEALAAAKKNITVPTLVLWGECDPALRISNLEGLDRYVDRLTIMRHPTATHWIVHEEPEWVNAAIRHFIQSD